MIVSYNMTRNIRMLCDKNKDFWHYYHYWICQDGMNTCVFCPYYINERATLRWECAEYAELREAIK